MSLDFNRHPHLVSEIEVYPRAELPYGTPLLDTALIGAHDYGSIESYFRYKHRDVRAPVLSGVITHLMAPVQDEYISRVIGDYVKMGCYIEFSRGPFYDLGAIIVRHEFDFSGTDDESKLNVKHAVAAVFGYEPGLELLEPQID